MTNPTAAVVAAAVLAAAVESGVTVQRVLMDLDAVLAGVNTGAGTGTETYQAAGNAGTTRLVYTIDSSGNRSAVVRS